jgi:uncharacterized protein with HEPN domain
MKNRDVSEFLQDMLEAIQEIEAFTAGVDFEAFQGNREKILAVVKLLEILGEAVKQIPDELRDRYPHIAWSAIAGMRNILVHKYWGIDVEVVWASVQEDVPMLKAVVSEMLSKQG